MGSSHRTVAAIGAALCLAVSATSAGRAGGLTREEAHAVAVEAYLYLYPLVTMDVTRQQATNVALDDETDRAPMNTFSHVPASPPPALKSGVRSHFDMLSSSAWLDVSREPVIVSVPDTGGRYYVLPMLDMWTDVVASLGWRTTGTKAGNFLVALPSWRGTVPTGVVRIDAPTPYVWIRCRTRSDGPDDYAAVHAIQTGYAVTPLSRWGKPPAVPPSGAFNPILDMKTPPRAQVDTMSGEQFFTYAMTLLNVHPPHVADQPVLARMRRIGLAVDGFDMTRLTPSARDALLAAPAAAQQLMTLKSPSVAHLVHGWTMSVDTMGAYGTAYLKRAIIAQLALGADLPEDVMSAINLGDYLGSPLDGSYRYRMHFEASALPPVDVLWSVTLYDTVGAVVPNALSRFAVTSAMPLQYNADGSLDLYFEHDTPGPTLESNWLPAPEGPFTLVLRLYAPQPQVLHGKWSPPPVVKVLPRPRIRSRSVVAGVTASPDPR